MDRQWELHTTWYPNEAYIEVELVQYPELVRPEPEHYRRFIVRPPGPVAQFLGDTLEKRFNRARRRLQRWCNALNRDVRQVRVLKDKEDNQHA